MIEIEGIKFYTTLEAAKLLKVTPETIRAYIRSGKLEARRIGRSNLISHKQILRFLGEPIDN